MIKNLKFFIALFTLIASHGIMGQSQSQQIAKNPNVLYVIEGEIFKGDLTSISSDDIAQINVLKGEKALEKYGPKYEGAIEITLKRVVFVYFGEKIDQNQLPFDLSRYKIVEIKKVEKPNSTIEYGKSGHKGVWEINLVKKY